MKLIIHYQTNRKPIQDSIYYPEDERTPRKRVDYVIQLGEQPIGEGEQPIDMIVVSACPYIIDAFDKIFKNADKKFYIDEVEVHLNEIFEVMAAPMKELVSI